MERYLAEGSPRLQHFAQLTASLAAREEDAALGPDAGMSPRAI